jgi:polysaccharide biosynthesis/export protein ExoF
MHNWLGAIAFCLAAFFGGVVHAQEYVLGPQDVLMVRVGHWDEMQGGFTAWTDLNGQYTVAPDGTLALPLSGPINAAGRTPVDVADDIAVALGSRVLSRGEVQVTVDIVQFRPVYVLGAVRSPGAYPYTPGLTVLQAIGLAGGMPQVAPAWQRNERSALSSLGSYEVLNLALMRALATEARLLAEREGSSTIETPPELENAAMGRAMMDREREIFDARAAALESAVAQLDSLETILRRQIDQMAEQVALRERQRDLADEELANIADLVERGLTVAARLTELESRVADQEIRLLELATARLNAEQRLNEARRERLDLVNMRARDTAERLLEVQSEIESLRIRMRTEAALYAEATQYEDGYMRTEGLGAPTFELTRGGTAPVVVTRTDLLQPGDVLELVVPLPGDEDFPSARTAGSMLPRQP